MDKAPTITRSTPIHIDALNKRIERLKRDKADLRAEAHGLERALIAEAALVARERQAAAEAARTAELNRLQQMVEAQDALTRIKTQMEVSSCDNAWKAAAGRAERVGAVRRAATERI